jgi:hypothetical protein
MRAPGSITCPRCDLTSSNPLDVKHGYCGRCGDWTSEPIGFERAFLGDDFSGLCFALGGSDSSWTGDALRLIGKSDPQHRAALRRALPGHVAAWETWQIAGDVRTAYVEFERKREREL